MTSDTAVRTDFQLVWHIDAPPAAVFRAWTTPAELGWFLNDAMPVPPEPIEVDLRVGGVWRLMMVISEEQRYFTGGVYEEIVLGETLVFRWGAADGWPPLDLAHPEKATRVSVTFKPAGAGTELRMHVEIAPGLAEQAARDGLAAAMNRGWQATVDRLVARLNR